VWIFGQSQRACLRVAGEPALDERPVSRDLTSLGARGWEGPRLHTARDLVYLVVAQLAAALEQACGHRRVARRSLAIDHRVA
jgi:hypothetical protein